MAEIEIEMGEHGKLIIPDDVLERLFSFSQKRCWQSEAGGQLFAEIGQSSWTLRRITGPRRSDVRSRFGFQPNRDEERKEIIQSFSDGLHYVGDWHTHPQDSPKPSLIDLESMEDIVNKSDHALPGFLMMIVGRDAPPSGLWASLHFPGGGYQQLSPSIEETS